VARSVDRVVRAGRVVANLPRDGFLALDDRAASLDPKCSRNTPLLILPGQRLLSDDLAGLWTTKVVTLWFREVVPCVMTGVSVLFMRQPPHLVRKSRRIQRSIRCR